MTKPAPAPPPGRRDQQDPWRPTGNLARRLARTIYAAALASAATVALFLTIEAVAERRAAFYGRIDVAIATQRDQSFAALDLADVYGAAAAAEAIGIAAGASQVTLIDLEGNVLGRYDAPAQAHESVAELPTWERVLLGYMPDLPMPDTHVERRVEINGDPLGSVEVVASLRPVVHSAAGHVKAALLAVLLVVAVAAVIVRRVRAQVAAPVAHLLETMDQVAHLKDYSLRASPHGPDEIGSLIVSFNEMLHQIHTRNQRLADHRRKLQELVVERTQSFERAAKEAERASRAKGDFLARMSHEIRTPMNGVVGMAELLENTRLEEQQHRMLQTMRSSADSLLSIINDILDFSRIEAGQLQVLETEFSPIDLVEEVCELLAPRAHERSLELVCDIDGSVPDTCAGDPIRVRQIVTNLLGNAVKYTEKGRIILRASAAPRQDGKVELKVVVEDTGLGIAESQLETIFEAFTQGDSFESRKHGGTGLGLAITKQLVTILRGDIGVTSMLGAGSTFWVTMPLTAVASGAAARWDAAVNSVLVVIEDEASAKSLARQLEAGGAQVWHAQSGHRALERLTLSSFGLVLMDEVLPDMTGFELLERMRGSPTAAGTPVVLLTSSRPAAEKARRNSVHSVQPDAHLPRPARRAQLRQAVAEALGRGAAEKSGRGAADRPELRIRVLLVEDSPVNREVAVGMLESLGCTVETASDGSVGCEQALSWNFDAILMDCQMPLMDGFEATRRIRSAEVAAGRRPMPIIALTANALQGDRERCLEAGMSDFISKPYTMKKLHDALAAAAGAAPRAGQTGARQGSEPAEVAPQPGELAIVEDAPLPVVDPAHIKELRSLGRPHLVQQAISMFQKQALQNLTELEAACAAGMFEDIGRAAHSLKSSSLSVGARRFAAAASECEQAARRGALETARRLAAQLRPEFATLCKALGEVSLQRTEAA
jgi:signal transduction histidine kinase/CheY-like chemotaxis protein/HPt (histidine-containing phosphotransfer) domain-containing protein